MGYRIEATPLFVRQVEQLHKAYRNIRKDYECLLEMLKANPMSGQPLGGHAYKIRLRSSDLAGGKSGGYRVITYVVIPDEVVYLVAIYSKRHRETIRDHEIRKLLRDSGLI